MDLSISADEQAGPMVATILVFLTCAGLGGVLFMADGCPLCLVFQQLVEDALYLTGLLRSVPDKTNSTLRYR